MTRIEKLVASGGFDKQHRVGQLMVWKCQTADLWGGTAEGVTWWRQDNLTQDRSQDLALIWNHWTWKDMMLAHWQG